MTAVVVMTRGVAERLRAEAIAAAPRECCGLLVGTPQLIDECAPTANLDLNPSRFLVDPAAHIDLNRRLRQSGRAVVGVYHSHPRGRGSPSPSDIEEANYPEFVYVILSDLERSEPAIAGYRIIRGIVSELRIEVTSATEAS